MKTPALIATTAIATLVIGTGITAGIVIGNAQQSEVSAPTTQKSATSEVQQEQTSTSSPVLAPDAEVKPVQTTDDLLLYLIEEEKLAHDVYTVLGDMWGGNIFANIASSETSHQDMVLTLLSNSGLNDPRSSEVGVFTNSDLQALYDQLIAQGSVSIADAYQVGIIIEETDIADLTEARATTSDSAILSTIDTLINASQNHLAAFQRKV